MVHMVHAMRHHWGNVGEPVNFARAEWQLSRVYAVLGRPEPAIHHSELTLRIWEEHGIGDFDLAFAYEALARAHAVAGHRERVEAERGAGAGGRREDRGAGRQGHLPGRPRRPPHTVIGR